MKIKILIYPDKSNQIYKYSIIFLFLVVAPFVYSCFSNQIRFKMEKVHLKIAVLAGILLFCVSVVSQTFQQIYSDNFETYQTGDYLAEESPAWSPWFGYAYEQAVISDDQAFSPTKSVLIVPDNDIVNDLGNRTSGKYRISFYAFIPPGKSGYYNIMMEFGTNETWAFDCVFFTDASGALRLEDAAAATFSYPQGEWIRIVNDIDLDNDIAEVFIEGNLIHTWQYSSKTAYGPEPGIKQLAVLDLYGYDETGLPLESQMYVDNYEFSEQTSPVPLSDYSVYLLSGLIVVFIVYRLWFRAKSV